MKTVDLIRESCMTAPAGLHYERLAGAEGGAARTLWERVFAEDTASFLDYYFSEKITDSTVHVLKNDDGQIVSMVHANPYDVMMHGTRRSAYYIVGVATAEPYRHRGCMAFLLQKAVTRAKSEGCPFVFLMPADAAIYEPFGFRYSGRLSEWERSVYLKERMAQNILSDAASAKIKICVHGNEGTSGIPYFRISSYVGTDAEILEAYAQKTLAERYDTCCVHDKVYFERLSRELASENGGIYLLWRREWKKNGEWAGLGAPPPDDGYSAGKEQPDDTLCGYFCYACEAEEYLQEVVTDREAERLFCEKSRKERMMFLMLEKDCRLGRTYFPELV